MMIPILAAAAAVAASAPDQTPPANCAIDTPAMLKLSPYEFDQGSKGWRSITSPDCNSGLADLIAAYRNANWGKLDEGWLKMSYWHEGQMRANAGQDDLAIPLLLGSVTPAKGNDRMSVALALAWSEYALATVAFLHHDLAALKAARARLAAIPEPAEYKQVLKTVPPVALAAAKWPTNLNVVDGLIACFGKPYSIAYGCRPK